MPRDYYEVLGVQRTAEPQDIKRAYRKLALEYHPDRNKAADAEERFKECSEAYGVLSDPEKRRIYDRAGHEGLRGQGYSGFSNVGMDDIFASFGDIFGDLFGFRGGAPGGARRGGMQRGSDVRFEMTIDFEEAVFGCAKEVTFEQYVACEHCDGSGAEPGSQPVRCNTCNGRGQVVHGQGLFLISATCPDCRGRGARVGTVCRDCGGEGRQAAARKLTIKVPAGFEDGASLRYAGEGEPGAGGGPPGNLYVFVRVRPHASLRREGDDLIAEATINMVEAALGTELEIDGVEGPEKVEIHKGTQPGDVVTLKKKGVPHLRGGGRGDLHVIVRVEIPTSLNGKQKKLLEELAATGLAGKKKSFFA
jgi:molecular chaperone DnaJ